MLLTLLYFSMSEVLVLASSTWLRLHVRQYLFFLYYYFWFKCDLGHKYHAPKVRPNWGSNSWPPDHNSTVHVTETPAVTTRPSVISLYDNFHWLKWQLYYILSKGRFLGISKYFTWIPHPQKHGCRHQNLIHMYPRSWVIGKNVISPFFVAAILKMASNKKIIEVCKCFYWVPHHQKHGCRHQNLISIYPRSWVIDKNVILPVFVAAILKRASNR